MCFKESHTNKDNKTKTHDFVTKNKHLASKHNNKAHKVEKWLVGQGCKPSFNTMLEELTSSPKDQIVGWMNPFTIYFIWKSYIWLTSDLFLTFIFFFYVEIYSILFCRSSLPFLFGKSKSSIFSLKHSWWSLICIKGIQKKKHLSTILKLKFLSLIYM